ncbi:MAG: hypothetical protein M1829_002913, partial [Trizodia sp. TS-e1964]
MKGRPTDYVLRVQIKAYIEAGKSNEWICKKTGLPLRTVQHLAMEETPRTPGKAKGKPPAIDTPHKQQLKAFVKRDKLTRRLNFQKLAEHPEVQVLLEQNKIVGR